MLGVLLSSRPPGHGHTLPDWAIAAARNQSKMRHQQAAWQKGDTPEDDDEVGGGAARRPRCGPRAKAPQGVGRQGSDGDDVKDGALVGGPTRQ